ncbi:MAG: fatty acid desaturase family protein [Acidimicrobiales bacterium]
MQLPARMPSPDTTAPAAHRSESPLITPQRTTAPLLADRPPHPEPQGPSATRSTPTSIASTTAGQSISFASALTDRVEGRLDQHSLALAYRRLHRKAAVVVTWYVASYLLMVTASGWLIGSIACVSLALSMAAVGFNIQHDANHNAFFPARGSKRLTVANRAAGWSIHAIGASSQRWIDGHVFVHHASPNVVGRDTDIELNPFARLAPAQTRHPWHRLQHLYLWPLYGFTAVSIIVADVVGTVTESFTGDRRGRRPTARDYTVLMATKSIFLAAMIGVPLLMHPVWIVALGATAVLTITGVLLGVVFQLAHAVTEAAFCEAANRPEGRWHEWQVRTSVDFCHGDGMAARALTWYAGGLNYQTENHLFPRLPHTAYPMVAPVVAEACADYSIRYHVQPNLRLAIRSHYRHVRELGRPVPA